MAILGAAAAIFVLAGLLALFIFKNRALPYGRIPDLFTPAERHFLNTLDQATPEDLRVFGKVRIADVLRVTTSNRKRFWRYFTQISSKHLDYVLVDRKSLRIVCAIELDDRSHDRRDRGVRDTFVNEACATAGLPLIRVPAARQYDVNVIRQRIAHATHQKKDSKC
ncbi:hypothetical protein MnBA_40750 [Marinobacterium sp. BA1]